MRQPSRDRTSRAATADYARAILGAAPDATDDALEELVVARMERQVCSARSSSLGFDEGAPSIVYLENAVQGQTIERSAQVRRAARAFDRLRAEALPRGASRDLIGKVAEERWTA